MNNYYKDIWDEIKRHSSITILSHIDPDGDTVGSATALKHLILSNTNIRDVKISGEKPPRYISFIDESEIVSDEYFNDSQIIVVDTSTLSRIHDQRVITEEAIKIDHHPSENNWKMEVGGDNWPATGQVLYEMCKALNLKINEKAAEAMWVAIWTDTDGLTQRNPSPITVEAIDTLVGDKKLMIEKLELNELEKTKINNLRKHLKINNNICSLITETIVSNDFLRQMTGEFSNNNDFEIYFGVTKVKDGLYRGELRSKGNIDVSIFAKYFGGGGHFSSSGFKCKTLEQANKNLKYIKDNI